MALKNKDMSSLEKIKICMASPLGYTGIAYYDHSLCQSLSEIGVDVTLITSKLRIVKNQDASYEIKKLFINTYGNRNLIKKGLNYLLSLIKIYFFIITSDFKIVHFQILEFPIADLAFFILLKLSGVKIIYTPHDIFSFKSNKYHKFSMFMYKFCNCIIAQNESNKRFLINRCLIPGKKIKIVVHGNYNRFLDSELQRDKARERIGVAKDKKIILFFGNIRPGKGLETLISALKLLITKANFLLLIAGKVARGYNFSLIKTEINTGILKDKVIIRDYFIDDNLVESYYKSSDVVLVPYEQVYESAVLRYGFSCGMPTIASNLKEFLEFAIDGENCLIFRAGDPVDLAKKLKMVLENENIAKKIAQNAKILSDNDWDWQKSAYRTKEIYEELQ